MSLSGFTELVQPETPTTSAPSLVSIPNNTPVEGVTNEQPLLPQLAIRSAPIVEDDEESAINYDRKTEPDVDANTAPLGFIYNDPDSRHYYPIYVPNPNFGERNEKERTIVARYIQYSADYTSVCGTNGKGYPQRNLPVTIGRQARHYTRMTKVMWEELRRGAPREFIINEALADMGDARVVGEVNRLRNQMETDTALYGLLQDAQRSVNSITREYMKNQQEMVNSQVRIERSNLYALINDQQRRMFDIRVTTYIVPS